MPAPLTWVTVSPNAGRTATGHEHNFTVTLDPDNMAVGDYAGYICVLDTTGRIKALPVMAGARLYLPMIQR